MAKVSKKIQEDAASILGNTKEPKYTLLNSEKKDLMSGLNYYFTSHSKEDSKLWAMNWVLEHKPELYDSLKDKKEWKFGSKGFVLRMISNGFVMDAVEFNRTVIEPLVELSQEKDIEVEEAEPKEKVTTKRVVKEIPNQMLEEFDYSIDDIILNKQPRKINLVSNKKHIEEVITSCNKLINDIEVNYDAYCPKLAVVLKRYAKTIIEQYGKYSQNIKQSKLLKAKPKNTNPLKMVSKMKFLKEFPEFDLKSIKPDSIIGAKQVFLYNIKYRTISHYVALTSEGLIIQGTSLKNYDIEKSKGKRLRKPEEFFKDFKSLSIPNIKKLIDDQKSKPFTLKGRINEDTIILKV